MATTLKVMVAGNDITANVDVQSFKITQVLNKEPHISTFTIFLNLPESSYPKYMPLTRDEVIVTLGTAKIFAGVVVQRQDTINGRRSAIIYTCKDYTQWLDRTLVAKTYTSTTVGAVFTDIVNNFTSGFTLGTINCSVPVSSLKVNYESPSRVFAKLINLAGQYDWTVDYNKVISLFPTANITAPFNIDETTGNFWWNSLKMTEDITQLRNRIYLKGATSVVSSVNHPYKMSGVEKHIMTAPGCTGLNVQYVPISDPTHPRYLSIGKDGVDNPSGTGSYDAYINSDSGLLVFNSTFTVVSGDMLNATFGVQTPLIQVRDDSTSEGTYGKYEYLLDEQGIKDAGTATQRIRAELSQWAHPVHKLEFTTTSAGLKTGLGINVNLPSRSIGIMFRITRIEISIITQGGVAGDILQYDVQGLASEEVTMVDTMARLLDNTDNIDDGTIVNVVYGVDETINLGDTLIIRSGGNVNISESVGVSIIETLQPLGRSISYALGPFVPDMSYNAGDAVRSFILDMSPLGAPPQGLSYGSIPTTWSGSLSFSPLYTRGDPGTSFSVSPALPSGISLNSGTGVLSGNPSGHVSSTTYTITAINEFGQGSCTVAFAT